MELGISAFSHFFPIFAAANRLHEAADVEGNGRKKEILALFSFFLPLLFYFYYFPCWLAASRPFSLIPLLAVERNAVAAEKWWKINVRMNRAPEESPPFIRKAAASSAFSFACFVDGCDVLSPLPCGQSLFILKGKAAREKAGEARKKRNMMKREENMMAQITKKVKKRFYTWALRFEFESQRFYLAIWHMAKTPKVMAKTGNRISPISL